MLMDFADRLAFRILTRRSRSIDDMLHTINRLCMEILTRTESRRTVHLANAIMDDVGKLVLGRQRRNGGIGGGR
jgi:hypothetical protein